MSIKALECHNQVDPTTWDEQAARVGGGFYHCHAATIYNSRVLQAEPLFISAVGEGGQCVGIATGTVASSRIWPFSRYCRQATFEATPVAGMTSGFDAVAAGCTPRSTESLVSQPRFGHAPFVGSLRPGLLPVTATRQSANEVSRPTSVHCRSPWRSTF